MLAQYSTPCCAPKVYHQLTRSLLLSCHALYRKGSYRTAFYQSGTYSTKNGIVDQLNVTRPGVGQNLAVNFFYYKKKIADIIQLGRH